MSANPDLVNAVVRALLSTPVIQQVLRKLDDLDARRAADEKARKKKTGTTMQAVNAKATEMSPEHLAHATAAYALSRQAAGETVSYSDCREHILKQALKGKLPAPAAPLPQPPVVRPQPVIDESGIGFAELAESVKQYCLREAECGNVITYSQGRAEVLKKLRKGKLKKVVTAAREVVAEERALYGQFEFQQRQAARFERSSSSDAAKARADRAVALVEKAGRRGQTLSYAAAMDMARDEGL